MKKLISILSLVLAMTMLLSVSAFATEETATTYSGFYDIGSATGVTVTPKAGETAVTTTTALDVDLVETDGAKDNEAVYNGSDSLTVTATATSGAYYGVLLVKGSALPTVDSDILYIDQKTASDDEITFDVLPILPEDVGVVKLYVSSNVEGASLIAVPMGYAPTAAYAPVSTAPTYTLGCVTEGDDQINISDVLLVLDAYLGTETLTDAQKLAADVAPKGNVDGNVNISDVLLILDYYLGTETSLN